MANILRGIDSLAQHLIHIIISPDDYRLDLCPSCGKSGLWYHGRYYRQADREHGGRDSLNPIPVPRFPLSFLQSNLFNTTRMPCVEALVSMGYSAGSFIYGVERMHLRPNHA